MHANPQVREAMQRAGLGTPELQAQHHAAAQQHVSRVVDNTNRMWRSGRLVGNGATQRFHAAQAHLRTFAVDVAATHEDMQANRTFTVFVTVTDVADDGRLDPAGSHLAATQMASRHGIAVATQEV